MKKIITGIILFVLGAAALIFGILFSGTWLSRKADREMERSEVITLTDANIGQVVKITLSEEQQCIDNNNYVSFCKNDERITHLLITVSDELAVHYKGLTGMSVPIIGTVKKCSNDQDQITYKAAIEYYEKKAEPTGKRLTVRFKDTVRHNISPYYIELIDFDVSNNSLVLTIKLISCCAGGIFILAGLVFLISALSKKAIWKIALIFAGLVIVLAIIAVIIMLPKLTQMSKIRKDDDGVYYVDYTNDLKFDDMIAANISSVDELINWIENAECYGLPINLGINRYGCSAFSAQLPEGGVVFGRNFDYGETATLTVHYTPSKGYEFYGVADLYVLGVSKRPGCFEPDSPAGRFFMLAAPYMLCDGINEAGLGISILELGVENAHHDTGKSDVFIYNSIPLVLERCATVDEAITLLGSYDIQFHDGVSAHLFIVDKSGRAVVVEWINNEMYVNETNACTNSVITPGEYYDMYSDERLPTITSGIEEHNGILTREQAKELLAAVSQEDYTQWSCVYDLNDLSFDLYVHEDFEHAYCYGG